MGGKLGERLSVRCGVVGRRLELMAAVVEESSDINIGVDGAAGGWYSVLTPTCTCIRNKRVYLVQWWLGVTVQT